MNSFPKVTAHQPQRVLIVEASVRKLSFQKKVGKSKKIEKKKEREGVCRNHRKEHTMQVINAIEQRMALIEMSSELRTQFNEIFE